MPVQTLFEGKCCDDCTTLIANGECSDDDGGTARDTKISARHPVGHCAVTCTEETHDEFSWRPCEACGSTLGGSRCPFVVLS